MNTEYTGPVEIWGTAEFPTHGLWNVHGKFLTPRPLRQRHHHGHLRRLPQRHQVDRHQGLALRHPRRDDHPHLKQRAGQRQRPKYKDRTAHGQRSEDSRLRHRPRRDPPLHRHRAARQLDRVHPHPQTTHSPRSSWATEPAPLPPPPHRNEAPAPPSLGPNPRALPKRRRSQRNALPPPNATPTSKPNTTRPTKRGWRVAGCPIFTTVLSSLRWAIFAAAKIPIPAQNKFQKEENFRTRKTRT